MARCLRIEHEAAVTRLTLNRPSRLNALDRALRDAIADALALAATDDAIRVVVLGGAGDRAFCAGQDLSESERIGDGDEPTWIASWERLFEAFLACPKPIVAAMNGVAAGGGLEMAMYCDIRIATPTAHLIMAEIDVGLPAMNGSEWLAAHVMTSRMLEIVLTGRRITPEEAARIGLIHHLVTPAELQRCTRGVSAALAAKPARAMAATVARLRDVRRRRLLGTDLMSQMCRYQTEAMASGEPQRLMHDFLAARAARRRLPPEHDHRAEHDSTSTVIKGART